MSILSLLPNVLRVYGAAVGLLLSVLIISACSSSSSTSNGKPPTESASKKDAIKSYDKVITKEAVSDSGVFIVHRIDDKFFFEIPKARFGDEFLLVSRVAKTPQVGYGGEENNTVVIRWERKYDNILLRTVSYENVADDSLPINRAVKAANFEEIIEMFPIKAYNKDSSNVVIEVTDFFTSDVGILTPNDGVRKSYKISRLDSKRSYVDYIKSFPTNVEIEAVQTFVSSQPSQTWNSNTMSFAMHHSMVELPKNKMMPRLADPRVGWFSLTQTDYGRPEPEATYRTYILRWRLEPSDTAAFLRGELVEPIKPITYYIDPATPVQWRPWLKSGIETWNAAFEEAGFKNAVRVLDPPSPEEDPDWHPEDARYSVIRYFPSPTENAYGPNIHDPRTGEILESDIGWYHNVLKLQTGWFFAQAVSDPRSRKLPYNDSLMGALIATVAAHEFGHTIGFPHNMKASNAYPVDSLRSKTFTAKYGTAPSIMDYARYNYIAQPGDDAEVFPKVGPYDHFATRWGYRPIIEAKTSDDELPTLHEWARETETDKMKRFGAQQWMTVDPTSQMEDLGDDPIKASTYGVKNLKFAMTYLYDATYQEGKNYRLLSEAYDDLWAQWRREMGHVANLVGGIEIERKVHGSAGGPVYTPIPKSKQKAAVAFLGEQVFTPPTWLVDQRILDLIMGTGYTSRVKGAMAGMLNTAMSNDKLIRLLEIEQRGDVDAYKVSELFEDLEALVFKELQSGGTPDLYRRHLQRTYVEELIEKTEELPPLPPNAEWWMALFRGPDTYNSDVRPIARARLVQLRSRLVAAAGKKTDVTSAHWADLALQIDRALSVDK